VPFVEPIAYVRNNRRSLDDDYWGGLESVIELVDAMDPDALLGLEQFSHAEVIYYFHLVEDPRITLGARRPRGNPLWPLVGIFAQRAKNRPNRIGLTTVSIREREGRRLRVADLDAVDGTPVLDIKPVMAEFLPRGSVRQPPWSRELMEAYWLPEEKRPSGGR